jgi:hypothetical protein
MRTGSGRQIEWMLLPPLSIEESLSLFKNKREKLNGYINLAISDCNGHPRSLEYIYRVCEKYQWEIKSYSPFFEDFYSRISPPPYSIIEAVLNSRLVMKSDCPPGDKKTYNQYIQEGVLFESSASGNTQKIEI